MSSCPTDWTYSCLDVWFLQPLKATMRLCRVVWTNADRCRVVWANADRCRVVWANVNQCKVVWANANRRKVVLANEGLCRVVWANVGLCRVVWVSIGLCRVEWASVGLCRVVWASKTTVWITISFETINLSKELMTTIDSVISNNISNFQFKVSDILYICFVLFWTTVILVYDD